MSDQTSAAITPNDGGAVIEHPLFAGTTRKALAWWWISVALLYVATDTWVYAWCWAGFSLSLITIWWITVETGDWR